MTFQLDTSGVVHSHKTDPSVPRVLVTRWSDLPPFEQGYVEAMFRTMWTGQWQGALLGPNGGVRLGVAFRDLAPETLARIREYCAAGMKLGLIGGGKRWPNQTREGGAEMFASQRGGSLDPLRFAPLTPYLGEDGKVYLREGVS